ncbi:hypothetical protein Tco_0405196 [Tanacetum coccineum]
MVADVVDDAFGRSLSGLLVVGSEIRTTRLESGWEIFQVCCDVGCGSIFQLWIDGFVENKRLVNGGEMQLSKEIRVFNQFNINRSDCSIHAGKWFKELGVPETAPMASVNVQSFEELLVYVRDTCPNAIKLSEKKVAITPMNKVKKVRFSKPLTSSSNIKQVESSKTSDFNTPVLSFTGLKCSTSTCKSQLTSNKKNDRISQKPSSNKKNKVEAQPRK